jgi:hypothetical protein
VKYCMNMNRSSRGPGHRSISRDMPHVLAVSFFVPHAKPIDLRHGERRSSERRPPSSLYRHGLSHYLDILHISWSASSKKPSSDVDSHRPFPPKRRIANAQETNISRNASDHIVFPHRTDSMVYSNLEINRTPHGIVSTSLQSHHHLELVLIEFEIEYITLH